MKYALPIAIAALATPVGAHSGPHLHPHGVEGWMVGLGVLAMVGAIVLTLGRRK